MHLHKLPRGSPPAAGTLWCQEGAVHRAGKRPRSARSQSLPTPLLHTPLLPPTTACPCSPPHLRCDGSTELADEGELVLLCVPLHDGAARPHLCHDAACAPKVNGGTVVPLP